MGSTSGRGGLFTEDKVLDVREVLDLLDVLVSVVVDRELS